MSDTEDSPMIPVGKGLIHAQKLFTAEGLHLPYIPPAEQEYLLVIAPGVFGTNPDVGPLANIESFITLDTDDYVLFGFNEGAVHYYCVHQGLGIFFQIEHLKDSLERINLALNTIPLLFEAWGDALAEGRSNKGKGFVIVESDYYGRRWAWAQSPKGPINPHNWQTTSTSILDAITAIEEA